LKVTRGFKAPAHAPETVEAARREFEAERGSRPFSDLVIVIAALNEAENLPEVLDEIPGVISGISADVLVVDDGSDDATSEVARRHGATVLRLERNCGHGVALRAGYRTAWEHGARFIATLDADGQWDPADLPAMVHMAATDQADLVIGSRALGHTEDTDSFRTLGVRVFSSLARTLTAVNVTDTSSGLRVMTPELLMTVPQTQPQYQTSELLIGAAMAGYRIAEVPTIMRQRFSGSSKKGRNLAYGLRYARVMFSTWWRESRRHGIRQSRPAFGTRMARYTIGSAFCLAVSELTLFILLLGGLSGWTASLLASAAGIIPGYPLNRAWTFGRRGRSHTWREVVPYWLTAIGGSLFAALLVGVADPWAKHAGQSALMATVISLFVYVGAYGTLWLLKFAYLDRMLFRPVLPDPPVTTAASVRPRERDPVLAGVTSDGPGANGLIDAFGSE
jgi:glycosyltransferase involved in cell wall biosynthesis